MKPVPEPAPFQPLVASGVLEAATLAEAARLAAEGDVSLIRLLREEYGLEKGRILQALAAYYGRPVVEYDERWPIPPELLTPLVDHPPEDETWFPVLLREDGSLVVAAVDPGDPALPEEIRACYGKAPLKVQAGPDEDIDWFRQDFLHAHPGELIGTERTGLAYWRNTMAQWRTLLACYRNDMAKSRTALAVTRGGLALVTISFALARANHLSTPPWLSGACLLLGCLLAVAGMPAYFRVRRSRLKPPTEQTMVEVTAATLFFLEAYHYHDNKTVTCPTKETMLARLSDFLGDFCTIFYPSPASRERTHLARERNVLAAQRTIAACYRTIYSRARTGLAFIRTGFAFVSIGIGLVAAFGYGPGTIFDGSLMLIGAFMAVDGVRWYWPTRLERADFSKLGRRAWLAPARMK